MPTLRRSSTSRCASATSSKREGCADERLHRPGLPEPDDLRDRVPHDLGPVPHQPPEVEADHAEVPPHQRRRIERLPPAAGEPEPDEHAERVQRRQRPLEDVSADRIEDDVRLHPLFEIVVEQRFVRPESSVRPRVSLPTRPSRPPARRDASRPGSPQTRHRRPPRARAPSLPRAAAPAASKGSTRSGTSTETMRPPRTTHRPAAARAATRPPRPTRRSRRHPPAVAP